ncbi:uncharacterized protein GIQ15_03436 [Arthroderma uncinatum]|uniref:uncharacterized protein n=1 Tax=Arthroderma uncinatum TaxID=74035 RepID=UPI00144A4DC9|nr:uncharacterized protein GIQ15_03436 [Arthroderma uncinatum]KAF3484112.1 hypothetical protein GIQ15_03436 [Arthroderma uncinatum]
MTVEMEKLELRKKEVETENARIVEENRGLLDQLEKLNQLLTESDAQVRTLTTTLQSTQLEVRRLSSSTKRVEQLEEQLLQLENEQAQLEETLLVTQESESAAIQRWRKAECTLGDLHDQLDRIEREARQEREKHVEMIGRLERRRLVERDLDAAAGRIKGAAATASLSRSGNGTNVVSHFVRDILKDNANLQQCVTELKEMLHNSNEDVRYLRDQLQLHQPLAPSSIEEYAYGNLVPLSEELEDKAPEQVPQEIHVHHHFHNPISTPPRREKQIPIHRRQKKRRPVLPPTLHEISPRALSMTQSMHRPTNSTSSVSSTFSQASTSLPHHGVTSALSSIPSSPLSGYRTSSIFDRHDSGFDSSRPTSPESVVFSPPRYKPSHRPKLSDASFRSIYETDEYERSETRTLAIEGITDPQPETENSQPSEYNSTNNSPVEELPDSQQKNEDPKPQECDDTDNGPIEKTAENSNVSNQSHKDTVEPHLDPPIHLSSTPTHRIRRSDSHESLISVSGMDIHTSSKPPSLALMSAPRFFPRTPKRVSYTGTIFPSPAPVISKTNAIVTKASLTGDQTSISLLSSVVSTSTRNLRIVSDSAVQTQSDTASTISASSEPTLPSKAGVPIRGVGIGKRMGGWVRDKWSTNAADEVGGYPSSLPAGSFMARPPGVNQIGPILGLRPPPPAPVSLHPENLNQDLLQESLLE